MELTESYFLGRAVIEHSDMGFFYPMAFLRGNLSTALYFDFLQFCLQKMLTYFSRLVSSERFL